MQSSHPNIEHRVSPGESGIISYIYIIHMSVFLELACKTLHAVCAVCMHWMMPGKCSDEDKLAVDCFLKMKAQLPYGSH
jgi:hypothetical protein